MPLVTFRRPNGSPINPPASREIRPETNLLKHLAKTNPYCYAVVKRSKDWLRVNEVITFSLNTETVALVNRNHIPLIERDVANACNEVGWKNTGVTISNPTNASQKISFIYPPKWKEDENSAGIYCLRNSHGIKVGKSNTNAKERALSQIVPGMILEWIVPSLAPSDLESKMHEHMNDRANPIMGNEWWDASKFSATNLFKTATQMEEQ